MAHLDWHCARRCPAVDFRRRRAEPTGCSVLLVVLLAAGIGYYTYTGEIVGIGLSIVSSLRDMFGIDMGQMLPK